MKSVKNGNFSLSGWAGMSTPFFVLSHTKRVLLHCKKSYRKRSTPRPDGAWPQLKGVEKSYVVSTCMIPSLTSGPSTSLTVLLCWWTGGSSRDVNTIRSSSVPSAERRPRTVIPTPAANLHEKWKKFNNLLLHWYLQQAAHGDSNARSKSTKENRQSLIICCSSGVLSWLHIWWFHEARSKYTKENGQSWIICLLLLSSADCTFGDSNARSKSTKENGQSLIICFFSGIFSRPRTVILTPAANLQKKMGKI